MREPTPPVFATVDDFVRSVGDVAIWESHARAALRRSGLPAPGRFRIGTGGTFPTLMADTGLVVKLFADCCDGAEQHRVESEAYRILAASRLPMPTLVATGELAPRRPSWRWPYLVVTEISGRSFAQVRRTATQGYRQRIAAELGRTVRAFHAVPPARSGVLRHDDWRFRQMLRMRRAQVLARYSDSTALRAQLSRQLAGYLCVESELLDDRRRPVLLHGDLHGNHIFVDPDAHRIAGIIDFADAFVGDPHYELVNLHIGAFDADKSTLRAFLRGYRWSRIDAEWPRRMLTWTILHNSDCFGRLLVPRIDASVTSLDQLADLLWRFDAP